MISTERLFEAWREFQKGKTKRKDVQDFWRHLERNIFQLQRELAAQKYRHSAYSSFFIKDPKVRHIRKACVRDRLVHQVIYTELTRIFEPRLIHDLYSSRLGKGTHAGVNALARMARKVSKNFSQACWALKCDIRKFYDTVDHPVLLSLLEGTIGDNAALWLIREVIKSFHTEETLGKGLPIGNLTSQVFTNIYLNELDQFVKHDLKVKHYARFADDFVLLSESKFKLEKILPSINHFLEEKLKIGLHPAKVEIRPLSQGIDFLGYVIRPYHRVLRTKTKRRMLRKLDERLDQYFDEHVSSDSLNQSMQSYLGMMIHADTFELRNEILNQFCWLSLVQSCKKIALSPHSFVGDI